MKRIDSPSTDSGPFRRLVLAACVAGLIAGGTLAEADGSAGNGKARGSAAEESSETETGVEEAGAAKRSPFSGLARFFSSRRSADATEAGDETETGPDPTDRSQGGADRAAAEASERAGRPRGLAALLGLRREEGDAAQGSPQGGDATIDGAGDPSRADKYVITETATPFYEDSPLQARGVDRRLAKGTIVTLVKLRKGWTDIVLETGELGTVPTETLRKAVASDFPVPAFVVKEAETSPGVAAYYQAIADLPPVPLPSLPDGESGDDGTAASPLLDNSLLLLPPLDPEPVGDAGAEDDVPTDVPPEADASGP